MGFQGGSYEEWRAALEGPLQLAKKQGTAVPVELGGVVFALHPRSTPGFWWRLDAAEMHVTLDARGHLDDWDIEVRASAKRLAQVGDRVVLEEMRRVAEAACNVGRVKQGIQAERVRQIDLCVDVVGMTPTDIADIGKGALLVRKGMKPDEHQDDEGSVTGYTIGAGDSPIQFCIYDKLRELADNGDDEKREIEEALLREAGWNGSDAVTRYEARFHGDALAEFDAELGGLRDDPDRLLHTLDALWRYVTHDWLRIIRPETATRRTNCLDDPRWRVVMAARFDARPERRKLKRTRLGGFADAKRGLSFIVSALAAAGGLCELPYRVRQLQPDERPRESPLPQGRFEERTVAHVEGMSVHESAAFVREYVREALDAVKPLLVDGLVETKGIRGAAAYLVSKNNAAHARCRSLPAVPAGQPECPRHRIKMIWDEYTGAYVCRHCRDEVAAASGNAAE